LDYDGDGKFHYAVFCPGTSQATFYIQRSSDNGIVVTPWGISTDLVVPGDYDGDGKTDVAVFRRNTTTTSNLVWYILKSSDGGVTATSFGTTETDVAVQNDYDGDGITNFAISRESDGTFWIWKSTTNTYGPINWGFSTDLPIARYDTH
jgi:hypothetical protein